ncbi:MAG TPA: 5'-3' exonuclease H3TH domain-containing protein [Acidimicrobiales bacterium]|nr:5'-3' exonuclease H3TH domain-containing protein [Acidimicrobiales bacterium]
MKVYLIDGTYELFRQFYGRPPRAGADGTEVGAVVGVLREVVSILGSGATHVGVATDHVIESFRNELWPGYKTGSGVPAELMQQFPLLESALEELGVVVWAMSELEADDALASAAAVAADDASVDQVLVCTPDKDLAQCVVDARVVQVDRRTGEVRDDAGVRAKFGVEPRSIPDWLALVGDSADGFPGLKGWGKQSAATVLAHYVHVEDVPTDAALWDQAVRKAVRSASTLAARLAEDLDLALLFKDLATLRVDRSLLAATGDLEWRGPRAGFERVCEQVRDSALAQRATSLGERRQ